MIGIAVLGGILVLWSVGYILFAKKEKENTSKVKPSVAGSDSSAAWRQTNN